VSHRFIPTNHCCGRRGLHTCVPRLRRKKAGQSVNHSLHHPQVIEQGRERREKDRIGRALQKRGQYPGCPGSSRRNRPRCKYYKFSTREAGPVPLRPAPASANPASAPLERGEHQRYASPENGSWNRSTRYRLCPPCVSQEALSQPIRKHSPGIIARAILREQPAEPPASSQGDPRRLPSARYCT